MSSASSGSGTTMSSRNRSALSYGACDYGLVVVQRLLICFSILLGYDLLAAQRNFPQMCLVRALTRIIRNFFFITKALRKWLAINYNDGVIPEPPIHGSSRFHRMHRSTPRHSALGSSNIIHGGSLKHSPIERRYSEPASGYDFATALKDRHNRSHGTSEEHLKRYHVDIHSSDFLWNSSSISVRFLLNGLAQSFLGYIEDPDPDEEVGDVKRESAVKTHPRTEEKANLDGIQQEGVFAVIARKAAETFVSVKSQLTNSDLGEEGSENRRRNEMVVESVLDHDAQQQMMLLNSFNSSSSNPICDPLPAPNFDDTTSPPS